MSPLYIRQVKTFLEKLPRVRTHEIAPFCGCFLILFLIGVAATIGVSVANALFLNEVGAAYLPQMMVFNALAIIVTFTGYNRITARLSPDDIFYLLALLFGSLIALFGLALFFWTPPKAVYASLLPLSALFCVLCYAHFDSYLGHFFDPMQSKRLLPAIFSATAVGVIVGGALVPTLLHLGGRRLLVFVWAGVVASIAAVVRANRGNRIAEREDHHEQHLGVADELRAVAAVVSQSRFIRLSLLFVFLSQVLVAANQVISSTVFAAMPAFADSERLMAFYGAVEGTTGCVALVVQLAVIPLLIHRFGVGGVAVITPLLQTVAFGGLTLAGAGALFPFAVLALANVRASNDYVDPIAQNLLLNALGSRQQGQVAELSRGLVGQSGPLVAGLFLSGCALLGGVLRWSWVLALLAGAVLLVSRRQVRQYSRELIRLLQEHNFDLFQAATKGMHTATPEVFAFLEQNLSAPDPDTAAICAQFLAEIRQSGALPALGRCFQRPDPPLRCALLQIFVQLGESPPEVRSAVLSGLEDGDPTVQKGALLAFSALLNEERDLYQLLPLLSSPYPATSSLAAVILFNGSADAKVRAAAKAALREQLASDRTNFSSFAIDALAHLGRQDRELLSDLTALFTAPMPLPRQAAQTLQRLASRLHPSTIDPETELFLRGHAHHPAREVRLAVYQSLAANGSLDQALLVEGLADDAEKVRSWLRGYLVRERPLAEATLRLLAEQPEHLLLWESAHLLQAELLAGNDDAALLTVIDAALGKGGETLACLVHCERHFQGERHALLRTLLADRLDFIIATAVALLGQLNDADIAALVIQSIRSGKRRVRASAMEALEQLEVEGVQHTTRLFEPFLLPLDHEERLTLYNQVRQSPPAPPERLFDTLLTSADGWERAIARHSLEAAGGNG